MPEIIRMNGVSVNLLMLSEISRGIMWVSFKGWLCSRRSCLIFSCSMDLVSVSTFINIWFDKPNLKLIIWFVSLNITMPIRF
jgi:hypothetical protein